jgi:RNA polymerase sigma-70 factor (ECF subfamily)
VQIVWDRIWAVSVAPPGRAARADEADWIAASRGGDPDAFEELVRLHQHRVFRLAGRFFKRREDVEDAAQETFLTAWRKLSTYRGEAPLEHWLTRVCLNTCYRRLRKSRVGRERLEDHAEPVAPARDPGAGLEVERLLSNLAPKDRFMLLLLDGEGWSVVEIAERLGWSPANVKVRAHRARKRLRRMLEEESR